MRRSVMKLVAKTFLTWIANRLPPAGKPHLHNLEAEFVILIETMPEGVGPAFDVSVKLNEKTIKDIIDWTLKAVRDAHTGEVFTILLTYIMGILEDQAVPELIQLLASPPSVTDPHSIIRPQEVVKTDVKT